MLIVIRKLQVGNTLLLIQDIISTINIAKVAIDAHLVEREMKELHQPVHRSSIVDRGFTYASPAVWNDLPPIIRSQPTHELFKRRLKTQLFKIAINEEQRRLWQSA